MALPLAGPHRYPRNEDGTTGDRGVSDIATEPPARFSGRTGPYLGLLAVNFLLNLVTFGFYRFWARTRLRRFLWSQTSVLGDALEYRGRGLELFLGFLLAMVILGLVSGAIGIVQLTLAVYWPVGSQAAGLLNVVMLAILIPFARYRARRYRLIRTAWRGIRGGQDGSGWHYALRSFGWGFVTLVSLGLARPWADMALTRYRMNHTLVGRQRFTSTARGGALFWTWLPVPLMTIAVPASIGFVVMTAMWGDPDTGLPFEMTAEALVPTIAIALALLAAGTVGWVLLNLRYLCRRWTHIAATARLVHTLFSARLSVGRIAGRWLLALFASLAVFVLLLAAMLATSGNEIVVVREYLRFAQDGPDILLSDTFERFAMPLALKAGGALAITWLAGRLLIWPAVFDIWFMRHLCAGIAIADSAALDRLVESERTDPRTGEGLADALDLELSPF